MPCKALMYGLLELQVPERDLLYPQACMSGLRVQQVACGGMSSMVLTDTGDVWAWGEPWGDFALTLSRAPTKVSSPSSASLA